MKVAHLKKDNDFGNMTLLERAHHHEVAQEYSEAAAAYERALKEKPVNELAFNRLMILYRKLKDQRKELYTINSAIKTFEDFYTPKGSKHGSKVSKLSLALAKSTGLVDKKGKNIFDPEPIAKWKKRKMLLEKKIKSKK